MKNFTATVPTAKTAAIVIGLALALGGCISEGKPFAFHPISEIPRGPGLLSGAEGGYKITFNGNREQASPPPAKQAPRRAAKPAQHAPQHAAQQADPAPAPQVAQQLLANRDRMVEAVTRQ